MHRVADPAPEAGIGGEEIIHPLGVAGKDDIGIPTAVLHHLDDGRDGLVSVHVLTVVSEGVCLIDEEYGALCPSEDLLHVLRCPPHVPADDILSADFDELSFR